MFKERSQETELMDDLDLVGEDLKKNLDELEFINYWLGGHKVVTSALNQLLPRLRQLNRPVTIADMGCGGGDTLRQVAKWARKKGLEVNLTGIDANAFMLQYARSRNQDFPEINLQQHNIFSEAFKQQRYDVLICSLFCHHFSDQSLTGMLRQLYRQANVAVVVNDLHRHPLAYYSIKGLTQLFSGSYLVKNDAPLSVLRAFRRPELEKILAAAGIENYQLNWFWAFRWRVLLLK
ncbi:MAG TPA: methyltransferase domain-containing protein [Adhaeribacter sp.]|nr:methyltransferase domain-containing protein [Adhaeribacter sp.]